MNFRIANTKAACNKNRAIFTTKLNLNSRKKPIKCCIWIIASYSAENLTLRKVNDKYLDTAKTTNTCTELYHSFTRYTGSYMFRQWSAIIRELFGFV
jgi:hypothetical protein